MALTETSRLYQIIFEADENGLLSRAFRNDIIIIMKDGVEISRSLNILPLEAGDSRVVDLVGAAIASASEGIEEYRKKADGAITGRDAALARAENLEDQITELQAKLNANS